MPSLWFETLVIPVQCIQRKIVKRQAIICSKGLCDNCLVPGHTANSCPKPRFCRVTGCTGNHSSFLHPRSVGQIASPSATNLMSTEVKLQMQDGPPEVLNGYVKGRSEEASNSQSKATAVTGLAVVPVKVKVPGRDGTVQTYAFLDSSSNTSFCSEDLAKTARVVRPTNNAIIDNNGEGA